MFLSPLQVAANQVHFVLMAKSAALKNFEDEKT
jgi:hypothetical protein